MSKLKIFVAYIIPLIPFFLLFVSLKSQILYTYKIPKNLTMSGIYITNEMQEQEIPPIIADYPDFSFVSKISKIPSELFELQFCATHKNYYLINDEQISQNIDELEVRIKPIPGNSKTVKSNSTECVPYGDSKNEYYFEPRANFDYEAAKKLMIENNLNYLEGASEVSLNKVSPYSNLELLTILLAIFPIWWSALLLMVKIHEFTKLNLKQKKVRKR